MEVIFLSKISEVRKNKGRLEGELGVKLKIVGKKIEIDGESVAEYDALQFFEAVNFGFSIRKALLLKNEDYVFKKIHIKEYTKRSLKAVRARLIGTKGKTRKAMSEISGCEILIKESEVGVVGERVGTGKGFEVSSDYLKSVRGKRLFVARKIGNKVMVAPEGHKVLKVRKVFLKGFKFVGEDVRKGLKGRIRHLGDVRDFWL